MRTKLVGEVAQQKGGGTGVWEEKQDIIKIKVLGRKSGEAEGGNREGKQTAIIIRKSITIENYYSWISVLLFLSG